MPHLMAHNSTLSQHIGKEHYMQIGKAITHQRVLKLYLILLSHYKFMISWVASLGQTFNTYKEISSLSNKEIISLN